MKRMILLILALVLGLAVGGYFALRCARRAPGEASQPVPTSPINPQVMRPIDVFQGGIKLDTKSTYAPGAKADQRLLEKLRRIEAKQRPQEGRN